MAGLSGESIPTTDDDGLLVYAKICTPPSSSSASSQPLFSCDHTSVIEGGRMHYSFNQCFNSDADTRHIYDTICHPLLLHALGGNSATLFVHGQSGVGKSHLLNGESGNAGLVSFVVADLFRFIKSSSNQFFVRVEYMELLHDEVLDLLVTEESHHLKITRTDFVDGAIVEGLTQEIVQNEVDLTALIQRGYSRRTLRHIDCNAKSSSSHVVLRLILERSSQVEGGSLDILLNSAGSNSNGCLYLVDLMDAVTNKGDEDELDNGMKALHAVIHKMGETSYGSPPPKASPSRSPGSPMKTYIPFRDSKLTQILKPCFHKSAHLAFLCLIFPEDTTRQQSLETLKFGQMCKNIRLKSSESMDYESIIKTLKEEVESLKSELKLAQSMQKDVDLADRADDLGIDREKIRNLVRENKSLQQQLKELQSKLAECEDTSALVEDLDHQRVVLNLEAEKMKHDRDVFNSMKKEFEDAQILAEQRQTWIRDIHHSIDEKESLFKTRVAAIERQKKMWEETIIDLTRREECLSDIRTKASEDLKEALRIKTQVLEKDKDISERVQGLMEKETALNFKLDNLEEKEKNLSIRMNKFDADLAAFKSRELAIRENEDSNEQKRVELNEAELKLKKEVAELDLRRNLLAEKEKIISDQNDAVTNKTVHLHDSIAKLVARERACDAKMAEAERIFYKGELLSENFSKALGELSESQKQLHSQLSKLHDWDVELTRKDVQLKALEVSLQDRENVFADLERREADVDSREQQQKIENERFRAEMSLISSKHSSEIVNMENLLIDILYSIKGIFSAQESIRSKALLVGDEEGDVFRSQQQNLFSKLRTSLGKINFPAVEDMTSVNVGLIESVNSFQEMLDDVVRSGQSADLKKTKIDFLAEAEKPAFLSSEQKNLPHDSVSTTFVSGIGSDDDAARSMYRCEPAATERSFHLMEDSRDLSKMTSTKSSHTSPLGKSRTEEDNSEISSLNLTKFVSDNTFQRHSSDRRPSISESTSVNDKLEARSNLTRGLFTSGGYFDKNRSPSGGVSKELGAGLPESLRNKSIRISSLSQQSQQRPRRHSRNISFDDETIASIIDS